MFQATISSQNISAMSFILWLGSSDCMLVARVSECLLTCGIKVFQSDELVSHGKYLKYNTGSLS